MSDPGGRSDAPGGSTPIDPGEQVEVTVRVRPRAAVDPAGRGGGGPTPRRATVPQPPAAFAAEHGADPADLAAVAAFAREHGLTVEESDAGLRSVRLSGPAGAFRSAFGVDLTQQTRARGTFHAPTGRSPSPPRSAGSPRPSSVSTTAPMPVRTERVSVNRPGSSPRLRPEFALPLLRIHPQLDDILDPEERI